MAGGYLQSVLYLLVAEAIVKQSVVQGSEVVNVVYGIAAALVTLISLRKADALPKQQVEAFSP